MAAKRGRKKSEEKSQASALTQALQFVQLAQPKDIGQPHTTHCVLFDGYAYATDGVLSAGHKISEQHINAFPHTRTMLAALNRCGEQMAVTQLDAGNLSIKSGKFRATVPCLPDGMPAIYADPPCAPATDALRDAIAAVEHLALESSPRVALASILLCPGSAISTNGYAMLEAWHGIDLPPAVIVPKVSAAILAKVAKPITKIGYSGRSITFWFDDDSWLKTQLYDDRWPDHKRVLDIPTIPEPLPAGFFEAVRALKDFGNEIFFMDGALSTSLVAAQGANIEVEGVRAGPAFDLKALLLMENCNNRVDFYSVKDKAFFFGENSRGVLMGIKKQQEST